MGASFVTMTLEGNLTREQVKKAFAEAQDQDRYENGHSYSGGIGMASGLKFIDRTFTDDGDDAEAFLADTCVKWEEARAVRVAAPGTEPQWLIGAWCAS